MWSQFKNKKIPKKVLNMKLKGKHQRGKVRSKWKQVQKHITQYDGRTWEVSEKQKPEEDKYRWRGFVARQPIYSENV